MRERAHQFRAEAPARARAPHGAPSRAHGGAAADKRRAPPHDGSAGLTDATDSLSSAARPPARPQYVDSAGLTDAAESGGASVARLPARSPHDDSAGLTDATESGGVGRAPAGAPASRE